MNFPITEIFHSLQGEGHFVGYPMTFVRFAGCSVLQCHIRAECDEAPWKAKASMTGQEIAQAVGDRKTICLTGGEPTDHDLPPLVSMLRDAGHRVHLETSGVRFVDGWPLDWITVSPKVPALQLRQKSGHTLKVVVRPDWSLLEIWERLHAFEEETTFFHRYVQPLTSPTGNDAPRVVEMLMSDKNTGNWALSTQAHRTWGIR